VKQRICQSVKSWGHNFLGSFQASSAGIEQEKPGNVLRKLRSRSYFTTDGHSVSMSWYRAPLWDLRPDITSCRNVAV
jgi:hypothetical protein